MWEKGQSHHGGATPGQVIMGCIEKQDAKPLAPALTSLMMS